MYELISSRTEKMMTRGIRVASITMTNCLQKTSPGPAAKLFVLCGVGQSTINTITCNYNITIYSIS